MGLIIRDIEGKEGRMTTNEFKKFVHAIEEIGLDLVIEVGTIKIREAEK